MQIARRICLPWWSFLLICAAAMAITALVVYEATTEPEPEAPVSYSFQPETGALTFYIPEGWELLRVFTDEGALTIPPYHQNTRSLTMRSDGIARDRRPGPDSHPVPPAGRGAAPLLLL